MAGTAGRGAGVASGLIFGGVCLLGLILLAIAAAIILSLIAIYTSNRSEEPYGDQYRIAVGLLKVLYTNDSGAFYDNGTIVDSATLSSLCGTVYRTYFPTQAKNFYACVMSNGRAYTAPNTSTNNGGVVKRRRRASTAALYEFYMFDFYYKVACSGKKNLLNYISNLLSGTSNTQCVKDRLTACNAFSNIASNGTDVTWTPLPSGFTQDIYSRNLQAYQTVPVTSIHPYPLRSANNIGNTSNRLGATELSETQNGCQYRGQLTVAQIAAIVNGQYSATEPIQTTTALASG